MPLERERAAVATPCRCDTHQPRRLACRRPWRKIAAGPLSRETGILYADIDIARCGTARRSLDVAGHYARPDVFELRVNRRPRDPIAFD